MDAREQNIRNEITKLEASLRTAGSREAREAIGAALDAWNGMLMEILATR